MRVCVFKNVMAEKPKETELDRIVFMMQFRQELLLPICQKSDKSEPLILQMSEKCQTSDKLTWSHICELISIDELMVEYATYGMDSNLFVSKYELFLPNKEELRKLVMDVLKK